MIVVRIIGERGFYKFVWIIQLQFHHQFSLGFGHVFALWFWKIFRKVFRMKEKKKKEGLKRSYLVRSTRSFYYGTLFFKLAAPRGREEAANSLREIYISASRFFHLSLSLPPFQKYIKHSLVLISHRFSLLIKRYGLQEIFFQLFSSHTIGARTNKSHNRSPFNIHPTLA